MNVLKSATLTAATFEAIADGKALNFFFEKKNFFFRNAWELQGLSGVSSFHRSASITLVHRCIQNAIGHANEAANQRKD
jgi:hypothetical protein